MTTRTHGVDGIELRPNYSSTMTAMAYDNSASGYNPKGGRDKWASLCPQARNLGALITFLTVAANPELWLLAPLGVAAWKAANARIAVIEARPDERA